MRNIIAFLLKHNFIVLFLLLQVVSYWLMVKRDGYQGSQVLNTSNAAVASMYKTAANTKEYFALKNENDLLAQENAMLRNLLKSNYSALPLKSYIFKDTLYKQQYTYVSAKVVNTSVNKRRNFMTLNIGKAQGIERDMAVISPNGIVGIVSDVSENFSSVMSVLHKDVSVNCQLKKDNNYGSIIWEGGSYEYCTLSDIPTHAKIKKGDTVITSELSGIFPEGIMVGTIESFERKQNDPFFTAKIKLGANLKKVNHVYIIKNKLKVERDSLETKTQVQVDD